MNIQCFLDQGIKKIHLGCGTNYKEGFINIDHPDSTSFSNSNKKPDILANILNIKYPDNTIEHIYLSHVFEHFQRHIISVLTCKWNRSLIDNGILEIVVPDTEECMKIFVESNDCDVKKRLIRHMWGSHEDFWATHEEGWNEWYLKEFFIACGFENFETNKISGDYPNIHIICYKQNCYDLNKIRKCFLPMDQDGWLIDFWMKYIQSSLIQ